MAKQQGAVPQHTAGPVAEPQEVDLGLLEWFFGTKLSPHVEALHAANKAAITLSVVKSMLHVPKLTLARADERMKQLEFCGDAPSASPAELRYAEALAPLRAARRALVRACMSPGAFPVYARLADMRAGAAEWIAVQDIERTLGTKATILATVSALPASSSLPAVSSTCDAAVAAADASHCELTAAYDALDHTPSRMGSRLRGLQMSDTDASAHLTDAERAYAALFVAVRDHRWTVAQAIAAQPVACASDAYDSAFPTPAAATAFAALLRQPP